MRNKTVDGILSTSDIFGTLYWISANKIQPVDITLQDTNHTWHLPNSIIAKEIYLNDPNITSQSPQPVGMVGVVDWASNGEKIAFWATLATIGQSYDLFRQLPWTLYQLDTQTMHVEPLLDTIYDASDLRWAPQGEWIAYTSGAKGTQPAGLWIISNVARKPMLVRKGHFRDVIWEQNGKQVISILCTNNRCDTTEIWRFDIDSLLTSGIRLPNTALHANIG